MTDYSQSLTASLSHLDAGNLEAILGLFENDATVHSSVLGKMPASEFFPAVFADTAESNITPLDCFVSCSGAPRGIAWFNYEWFLSDGTRLEFEAADVFEFSPGGLIRSLTLIYDSHPMRDALEASRYGQPKGD